MRSQTLPRTSGTQARKALFEKMEPDSGKYVVPGPMREDGIDMEESRGRLMGQTLLHGELDKAWALSPFSLIQGKRRGSSQAEAIPEFWRCQR